MTDRDGLHDMVRRLLPGGPFVVSFVLLLALAAEHLLLA